MQRIVHKVNLNEMIFIGPKEYAEGETTCLLQRKTVALPQTVDRALPRTARSLHDQTKHTMNKWKTVHHSC